MLHDVTLELHDLGLHRLVLEALLDQLAHEDLFLLIQSRLVHPETLHFLALLFQQVRYHSVLLLSYLVLIFEFFDFSLDLQLLPQFLRYLLLNDLNHILSILDSARVGLDVLRDQVQILSVVLDARVLLEELVSDIVLVEVEGVDHAGLLLDLVDDLLLLLLEALGRLLLTLDLLVDRLGLGLELLQVGLEMLNCLLQVLVALADANGLIAVLHVLLLQCLDLVLVLLLVLLHGQQLHIDLLITRLLLLDLQLYIGDLPVDFGYVCGHSVDIRDDLVLGLLLLALDLVDRVLLLRLEQVYLGLECRAALLNGLDVPVDLVDRRLELLQGLFVLLLLLLRLFEVEHLVGQLLLKDIGLGGQLTLNLKLLNELLVQTPEL